MGCICVWIGTVCRNHCYFGKMRDSEDRFQCGYGDQALQDGPASVVVPIDKLSIVVTVAFSGLSS